ncbi:hypothetical protein GQ53DRAFT_366062 [Thozetella sp. PMI_491]|nr:hypothetical protein GQ53DRAFT_366062 [Thozetella sp. PMI_491]
MRCSLPSLPRGVLLGVRDSAGRRGLGCWSILGVLSMRPLRRLQACLNAGANMGGDRRSQRRTNLKMTSGRPSTKRGAAGTHGQYGIDCRPACSSYCIV